MLKKYDTFFLGFTSIMFLMSFVSLEIFNAPVEFKTKEQVNLSESLNNVYMNGKRWSFQNGLYMLFTGLGMIGIIWLLELDLKINELYTIMILKLKKKVNNDKT